MAGPALASAATALVLVCPLTVPGAVAVDGFFTEWKAKHANGLRLGQGPDLTVELQCARDGQDLHLVVGVRDDRFTRGDRIAFSLGQGLDLVIDPGDLEEVPPKALGIPGARVDGATRPTGWVVEIGIPEAALRHKGWTPAGFDASITVSDQDGGDPPGTLASPLRVRFPDGADNLESWLQEAHATTFDTAHLIDLGGDRRPEWILTAANVVGVIGEGLGEVGMSGDVLPWSDQGAIVSVRGEDLDGDGTDELWIEQRLDTDDIRQTVMYVYDWQDDGLSRLAGIETRNTGPGWTLDNTLTAKRPKKAKPGAWATLVVRTTKPKGVRETSYKDVDAGLDLPYQPMLLPWGFTKKTSYVYESGRYLRVVKD